jgi:hypothetical protein
LAEKRAAVEHVLEPVLVAHLAVVAGDVALVAPAEFRLVEAS